jgi:hypothetical protein
MASSPEERARRGLRKALDYEFPCDKPMMLVTLPSALDTAKGRADLTKLRQSIVKINDPAVTGVDPDAPALWLVTRGMAFILIVNGSWRLRRWNRGRGIGGDCVVNDDDGSVSMSKWLKDAWPKISGYEQPCIVEKTRSGKIDEHIMTQLLCIPIMNNAPGSPNWGRWNPWSEPRGWGLG